MVRSAFAIAMALVLAPAPCSAGGEWVDRSELAVTMGVLVYTDAEHHDAGFVVGLEGRVPVAPRWLVAAGISTGGDIGLFGEALDIVPVEVEVLRVFPASAHFAGELGAGLAFVHGSHTEVIFFDDDIETEGWALGGQLSGGATAVLNWFVLGARVKYQTTGEFEEAGFGLDNFRITARAGVAF